MLLKAVIIGAGAAGEKACIDLMKIHPELTNKIMLVNTNMQDIPLEYTDRAIELVSNFKGCGKERQKANQIMFDNLKASTIDYPFDPEDNMCIIVTSSEGGTGSGGSSVIAKYISQVYNVPVHMYIFTGFGDDGRSLKNTVDLFSELKEEYTVHSISNAKFLDEANGNRLKAEKLANKKFADDVFITLGGYICPSDQNIDESDNLKIVNTPGYMAIEHVKLGKIRNLDDFNKKVIEAFDNSKNLTIEPTCKRLGVVFNISEKEKDFVDFSNTIIKERYGMPFESFIHVQSVHDENYIQILASGIKLPIADIKETYDSFIRNAERVDKSKDAFFSSQFDTKADEYNNLKKMEKKDFTNAKNAFFEGESSSTTDKTIDSF